MLRKILFRIAEIEFGFFQSALYVVRLHTAHAHSFRFNEYEVAFNIVKFITLLLLLSCLRYSDKFGQISFFFLFPSLPE